MVPNVGSNSSDDAVKSPASFPRQTGPSARRSPRHDAFQIRREHAVVVTQPGRDERKGRVRTHQILRLHQNEKVGQESHPRFIQLLVHMRIFLADDEHFVRRQRELEGRRDVGFTRNGDVLGNRDEIAVAKVGDERLPVNLVVRILNLRSEFQPFLRIAARVEQALLMQRPAGQIDVGLAVPLLEIHVVSLRQVSLDGRIVELEDLLADPRRRLQRGADLARVGTSV